MNNFEKWNGNRYYPISRYYRSTFGERIQKIAVNVAYTCPNREKGNKNGCVFCDEWGSITNSETKDLSIEEQIHLNKERLKKRFKARKFLVYFQSFTSTYTDISSLTHNLNVSLGVPDMKGAIIGTRPDCIPSEVIDLFAGISEKHYLSIELGVQSFSENSMIFLARGHTVDHSVQAIRTLSQNTSASIGIHLIFGLPDETDEQIIQTAQKVNDLPVNDVKLHNLHVLNNTGLHRLYLANKFSPIGLEEYGRRVILFLEHLSPDIPIQRLAAYAGTHGNLIAPDWTAGRLKPSQFIQQRLKELNTYQGRLA